MRLLAPVWRAYMVLLRVFINSVIFIATPVEKIGARCFPGFKRADELVFRCSIYATMLFSLNLILIGLCGASHVLGFAVAGTVCQIVVIFASFAIETK